MKKEEYCQLCALDLHEPIESWPLSILERPYHGKHIICAGVDSLADYMDAHGGPVRGAISISFRFVGGLFVLTFMAQLACNVLFP